MLNRPDFFYLYQNSDSRQLGCSTKFIDLFRQARDRSVGWPHSYTFTAIYPDGSVLYIPQSIYALPIACSKQEAIRFILDRLSRVRNFEKMHNRKSDFLQNVGKERCNYYDPVEQQIRDYIATSPWRWRTETEILGLEFLRFTAKKPCLYCDKTIEQHPFMDNSYGVPTSRLRKMCDGLMFVL